MYNIMNVLNIVHREPVSLGASSLCFGNQRWPHEPISHRPLYTNGGQPRMPHPLWRHRGPSLQQCQRDLQCVSSFISLVCQNQNVSQEATEVFSKLTLSLCIENPCILKQLYCRYLKYNNPTYLEKYEIMHAGTCDGSDPTKTVSVSLVHFFLCVLFASAPLVL